MKFKIKNLSFRGIDFSLLLVELSSEHECVFIAPTRLGRIVLNGSCLDGCSIRREVKHPSRERSSRSG